MDKLDSPRSILLGLTLIVLAVVGSAFLVPRARYTLVPWGDGPRFVRLDTFTGEAVACRAAGPGELLRCLP